MNIKSLFNPNGNADSQNPFPIDRIKQWLQSNHPDSWTNTGTPYCGYTALQIVAGSNRCQNSNAYDVAKLLLDSGANVNHQGRYGNGPPSLCRAIQLMGLNIDLQYKMLELLLSHGANPNYGNAPHTNLLGNLACNDNHKCLILMMQYGADPNRVFN